MPQSKRRFCSSRMVLKSSRCHLGKIRSGRSGNAPLIPKDTEFREVSVGVFTPYMRAGRSRLRSRSKGLTVPGILLQYPTPRFPASRGWSCTKYSRQRRHVQRRFAARNAPAGQRQVRTISLKRIRAGHWADYLPAPASASGSGKRRLGEVQVSAACCADLFWTDRGSLLLLTPWPWYRPVPVAAVPIPPSPATRGRRA
jgi:hypothetical protein